MGDGAPPAETVREQLELILASSGFRGSESLRRLLRYTVEAALAGRGDSLKEYTLGVEALGRAQSFDPRQDTIVRVQARKLRERLAAYYAAEGSGQPCRIVYRPGSYLPAFTAAHEAVAESQRTVAVLPLMNLTADNAAGYFCDGLAEELIDLLARTEGLRVVARTSSFQFKGVQGDVRDIGRRLGADLLIEGAVRNAGDRYRITIRLLSAADGCEIWASRYDRTSRDVLALEAEIAASIASALSSGTPPAVSATDAEGAILYLQARHAWNQRSETGFRRALELYTAATGRDPGAAKAWSGIAECHVLMNMHGLALPHVCMPKAREAALKALAIDPGLASAWSALAAVTCLYDRKFESAEEHWRKALELDPAYATAHHWYGSFGLIVMQRTDQALDEVREAERLDPLSAPIANDVVFALYWNRRFDDAIEQCRKNIALNPGFHRDYILLARVYAAQGRYRESVDTCLKVREQLDGASFLPHLLGTLGFAYASSGNPEAAREVLGELRHLEARGVVTAHERAVVATALGDWDAAIRELETAHEQRTGLAVFVPVEPLFDALRARGLLASAPSFT
jgi:TolB-like protein/Tfp pilus assembly protein PilF